MVLSISSSNPRGISIYLITTFAMIGFIGSSGSFSLGTIIIFDFCLLSDGDEVWVVAALPIVNNLIKNNQVNLLYVS
jgi:hypothetical protein